jgi:hypothetical protein
MVHLLPIDAAPVRCISCPPLPNAAVLGQARTGPNKMPKDREPSAAKRAVCPVLSPERLIPGATDPGCFPFGAPTQPTRSSVSYQRVRLSPELRLTTVLVPESFAPWPGLAPSVALAGRLPSPSSACQILFFVPHLSVSAAAELAKWSTARCSIGCRHPLTE